MEVGNRIRRERQRLGISQEELSRRAYVSRPTLSHWETGRTLPDAQSLLVLSVIFGTSIDELVKGDVAEMENMVEREDRAAHGRTIALACVSAAAVGCLVVTALAARPMVGSVALFAVAGMSVSIGVTVSLRGCERAMRANNAASVLSELDGSTCDDDEGVVSDRLLDQIAREGVRDPYARLVLAIACAVDVACALSWLATIVAPGLFV